MEIHSDQYLEEHTWDSSWTDLSNMGSRNLPAEGVEFGHNLLAGEHQTRIDRTCGCPEGGRHSPWCSKGTPIPITSWHWMFLKDGDVEKCHCDRDYEHMEGM